MSKHKTHDGKSRSGWILFCFVLLLSYFTYFHNYHRPYGAFWDESFYIADAQKELNGVFYMQFHPPFGKMLLALGEAVLQPNENRTQFLDSNSTGDVPEDFSFAGYRLFPALLSWFTAPLLFAIFFLVSGNPIFATFLSFPYIFDNALIVEGRGALLDGPLLFFNFLALYLFMLLAKNGVKMKGWPFLLLSFSFGVSCALSIAIKFQGAILLILFAALAVWLLPYWKKYLGFLAVATLGLLCTTVAVWQLHFARVSTVNPELNQHGYYRASKEYKKLLNEEKTGSISGFPVMFTDSMKFVRHMNNMPPLDLCKQGENGSPVYSWPFGGRAISFRWATPNNVHYHYLMLVANPATWLLGLIGLLTSVVYFVVRTMQILRRKTPVTQNYFFVGTLLALYFGFMITFALMNRVFFLHNYFFPLIVSYILLGIIVTEAYASHKADESKTILVLMLVAAWVILAYQFYRPLTYYEPLTNEQVAYREIFPWWELPCADCWRGTFWCPPGQPPKTQRNNRSVTPSAVASGSLNIPRLFSGSDVGKVHPLFGNEP